MIRPTLASEAIAVGRREPSWFSRLRRSRELLALLLLSPALVILLFVFAYPVLRTFEMAFEAVNLTRPQEGTPFIGLGNYIWLLTQNDLFWLSLQNTVILSILTIGLELGDR